MNEKPRRWWISGFFSLLSPGLGQIYNGQAVKGFVFFLLCNLLLPFLFLQLLNKYPSKQALLAITLLLIVSISSALFVFIDAVVVSCRLNKYKTKKYNKVALYIGVFLCAMFLPVIVPSLKIDGTVIKGKYLEAYKIPARSMEPTLLVGDRILVDRRPSARTPSPGDVVVFKFPKDETKDFIKRVVAVGGDTVEIRDKNLYVNEQLVKGAAAVYQEAEVLPASFGPRDNLEPITVPDGSFFVMGDNRDRSFDSRFWGFVQKEQIKGTATQIYWSWDRKTSSVRWDRIGKAL
jgi:signal peptidase I